VVDIIAELKDYNMKLDIFDPWADINEVKNAFGLDIYNELPQKKYELIIVAVAHDEFLNIDLSHLKKDNSVVFDVKNILAAKDGGL